MCVCESVLCGGVLGVSQASLVALQDRVAAGIGLAPGAMAGASGGVGRGQVAGGAEVQQHVTQGHGYALDPRPGRQAGIHPGSHQFRRRPLTLVQARQDIRGRSITSGVVRIVPPGTFGIVVDVGAMKDGFRVYTVDFGFERQMDEARGERAIPFCAGRWM